MKDCNGNYLPWCIEDGYFSEDNAQLTSDSLLAHPLCKSCEYIQSCKIRVSYAIECGEDM